MRQVKQTVANAVRVEINTKTDEVYIVFQIIDEDFKKRIKENWNQDIDLKLIGKALVEDK